MTYINPIVSSYIDKKMSGYNPALNNIERMAIASSVPIISRDVAAFLKQQVILSKAKNILEIGTAVGYSGSLMLLNSEAKLTTIELNESNYQIAKENFEQLGLNTRCRQIMGDASEVLNVLITEDTLYDLVFIDAAKGHYLDYFQKSEKILSENGIIIADNVLFKGYTCGMPYQRRQKTIVKRMNQFIDYVLENDNYISSLLSIGDGVILSIRKS